MSCKCGYPTAMSLRPDHVLERKCLEEHLLRVVEHHIAYILAFPEQAMTFEMAPCIGEGVKLYEDVQVRAQL